MRILFNTIIFALAAAWSRPRAPRLPGATRRFSTTERASHYFKASLSRRFDAVIHIDTTHAVAPLR